MAALGLVFGIGWAHETLYQRGITEMAMGWLFGGLSLPVSWRIDTTTTVVYAEGSPSDLQHLMTTMAIRLERGPDELERHKVIAQPEEDAVLLRHRYGYRSYGLAGATRYGYGTCTADDLRTWLQHIGRSTTRQFAAEFDPEPLRLGPVTPLPEPTRDQAKSAGLITIGGGFGLSWLQDRTPTVDVAGQIVLATVDHGIPGPGPGRSGVSGSARPIGADVRHFSLIAVDPEVPSVRISAVLDALERLRSEGPDELAIVAAVDQVAKRRPSGFDQAVRAATNDLWRQAGYRMPVDAELTADPEALGREVAAICATMQVLGPVPSVPFLPVAHASAAPTPADGSSFPVARATAQVGMPTDQRLVVGADRLTHFSPAPSTFTAESVAVVERRPDGERVLVDQSGAVLVVEPLVWAKGSQVIGWIDDHLPRQYERDERLPPDPYVVKAAARVRPAVVRIGAVVIGIIGLVLMIVGITTPEDRIFPLTFGTAFVVMGAVVLPLLLRHGMRLRRRVGP